MLRAQWSCLSINNTWGGAREGGRRRGREGGRGEMEINHSTLPSLWFRQSSGSPGSSACPWPAAMPAGPLPAVGWPDVPCACSALCPSPSQPDLTGGSFHVFNLLLTPSAEAFSDLGMNTFQTPHQSKCALSKSAAFNSRVFPKVYFCSEQ